VKIPFEEREKLYREVAKMERMPETRWNLLKMGTKGLFSDEGLRKWIARRHAASWTKGIEPWKLHVIGRTPQFQQAVGGAALGVPAALGTYALLRRTLRRKRKETQ
jgi:hypothetical protein